MRILASMAVGLLAQFAALEAAAQSAAEAAARRSEDEIVVTGSRSERVRAFVEQLSVAAPAEDQLARWDEELCPSILGLGASQGQFVADQIARRATGVGLRAGAPGCATNVFVFFTADSDALAQGLLRDRKGLLAYYHEENVVTLGQAALSEFIETPRAVRWWHVAQTYGADGQRLGGDNASTMAGPPPPMSEGGAQADMSSPAASGGFSAAQGIRSSGSRLGGASAQHGTRQDFNRAIIIVDGRHAAGVPLAALADYVAMVALAQIDPNADTSGFPSILNLFAARASGALPPAGMTAWDISYLDGLYHASRTAPNSQQQVREISRRMHSGDERTSR